MHEASSAEYWDITGLALKRRMPMRTRSGLYRTPPASIRSSFSFSALASAAPRGQSVSHADGRGCEREAIANHVEIIFFSMPTPAASARSYSSGTVAAS